MPYSVEGLDAATVELLKRQGFQEAYVGPIAWRGSKMTGVSARANRIWGSHFNPTEKLKGIRLDIAEYRRPDPKTAQCASKAAGLDMICTISKHAAEA
ncbi:hypothetical protein [Rhizobium leguminosarum]|uniref:hypothetical protein n=1 Tax=Rhizobium leguminosarum TaxID=384 RepID=UPI000485687F